MNGLEEEGNHNIIDGGDEVSLDKFFFATEQEALKLHLFLGRNLQYIPLPYIVSIVRKSSNMKSICVTRCA